MSRAVIISGGSIDDYGCARSLIDGGDCVICADSGIVHCEKMGITADLIVGDFDSCDAGTALELRSAKGAKTEVLQCEKDDTDTEHALMCACKMGFKNILILGALGGRADHTLANIFMLEKLNSLGVRAQIANENNVIEFLRNSSVTVKADGFKYVSVVPVSETANGVTLTGFKYPLADAVMHRASTLGISNEITGAYGTVTVRDGSVLVIKSKD